MKLLTSVPVKFISMMPEQIGVVSAILVVFMYTCLFMKLVSYIQVLIKKPRGNEFCM